MNAYVIRGHRVEPVDGVVLVGVHPADECAGGSCVIHAPTGHRMASWPLHWRPDRAIFERICDHGVGHPDPDQLAYWRSIVDDPADADAEMSHGCDGCCGGALVPPPALDAGCPTGGCAHLVTAHEAEDYAGDGTPIRPICTITGCDCGQQWRNT